MRVTAWKGRGTHGKELEADTSTINEGAAAENPRVCGMEVLSGLNTSLHEMSQPMTVLLCILDYGVCLETVEELKQTLTMSQEQCERLQKSVLGMQIQLREAIAEAGKAQAVD